MHIIAHPWVSHAATYFCAQYSQPIQCKLRMSVTIQYCTITQSNALFEHPSQRAHVFRIMFPSFSSLVFSLQGCHKVMGWVQLMHLGCIQQSHGISGMATADVEHGHRGTGAPTRGQWRLQTAVEICEEDWRGWLSLVIQSCTSGCIATIDYILVLWCHVIADTVQELWMMLTPLISTLRCLSPETARAASPLSLTKSRHYVCMIVSSVMPTPD